MSNTDNFLPDDYIQPESGGSYMKLQDGENKIRILSKPIVGWLDWKDKKPYRFHMNAKPEKPMDKNPIKHFWAFIVWNYNDQAVQILEITQQTIQSAINNLNKDSDWGSPFDYDIKITKKGKDLETKYSVIPGAKKPIEDDVKKAALDKPCYLDALYKGEDPWTVTKEQTELAFTQLPF
jgi:hypothetical protein